MTDKKINDVTAKMVILFEIHNEILDTFNKNVEKLRNEVQALIKLSNPESLQSVKINGEEKLISIDEVRKALTDCDVDDARDLLKKYDSTTLKNLESAHYVAIINDAKTKNNAK